MTQAPRPPSKPVPVSESEAWLAVSDELLWGINHALSNRLAALISLVRILEHSETGLDPLLDVLRREVDTLERTISLLRLLPRNAGELPEPVRLVELLPDVLALHRLQSEIRDLDFQLHEQPDLQPVWIEPATLAHALLLLLSAATRIARRARQSSISIWCRGDSEWVELIIESPPSPTGEPLQVDATAQEWVPLDARVVERLLEGAGGRLAENHFSGDPARGVYFELRLPTLSAVRRRQAAGENASPSA
jgi:hypothetical protein